MRERRAYITSEPDNSVSVINTATDGVIATTFSVRVGIQS
ncbi:hypothetical protein IH992_14230 [Candidatus Poribacteria bacterium]|nr:hypothetical protein [Candidatus Poribacteria bacterium]